MLAAKVEELSFEMRNKKWFIVASLAFAAVSSGAQLPYGGVAVGQSTSAQCVAAPGSGTGCLNGKVVQGVPTDAKPTSAVVLSKLLISDPLPAYPKAALDAHEEGLVSALILVGKDGHVEKVLEIDGPPSLLQVSTDAVQHWTYQPILTDGKPVRAMSTVFLTFVAGGGGDEPIVRHDPFLARISGAVIAGNLLTHKNPEYPKKAKAEGIEGTVVLHEIIGKDGKVQMVEPVSGPTELYEASVNVVREWTYRPYLLNGEPVAVESTVTVNFNLNRPKPK